MEFQPVKYPQLRIIIPPSHPPQSSTNEAPFSPIKPLFEGLSFQPQITSHTKTSLVTSGSSLSRKTSNPQRRSATSEMLASETLEGTEKLLPGQGRIRTLSVSSHIQGSVGNDTCQSG